MTDFITNILTKSGFSRDLINNIETTPIILLEDTQLGISLLQNIKLELHCDFRDTHTDTSFNFLLPIMCSKIFSDIAMYAMDCNMLGNRYYKLETILDDFKKCTKKISEDIYTIFGISLDDVVKEGSLV